MGGALSIPALDNAPHLSKEVGFQNVEFGQPNSTLFIWYPEKARLNSRAPPVRKLRRSSSSALSASTARLRSLTVLRRSTSCHRQ